MAAPHAHIDNTRGSRNKFGQDKAHFRIYRPSRQSIHTRAMHNISSELYARPEFSEVKYLRQKLSTVGGNKTIDNRKPKTYELAKKMAGNRQVNHHEI